MAVVNCKMCGSPLPMKSGATVVECEYCGREQTIPSMDNEKKLTLFARAERLRTACEFDKAAGVFEAIVADFPQEAEAYWGLVLCKYGIEYVDDPSTGEKIPTCHRSSFDSVFDDPDYEQAYDNADVSARKVYRAEGKRIEDVRRGIISVSANEDPYDIFICYKETAEDGNRTLDSVLAQDIYDALTDKGYRVFFARITLEDKLGQEYEPYIFAALNSAKIMLAVGTDFEYYNAVWVKNEWSRYLKLMARDKTKHLIPCFKGLDAYDMPKEFAKLQAQDLGKVGAMQDLLRGIEKLLPRQKEVTKEMKIVKEKVVVQQSASVITTESLLKRAFMYLEDGDWNNANTYCERVLDVDPENVTAYLGKLMLERRAQSIEDLAAGIDPFENSKYYEKVMRFGDECLKAKLQQALEKVRANKQELDCQKEKKRLAQERHLDELRTAREKSSLVQKLIATSYIRTAGLRSNGTVMITPYCGKKTDYHGQYAVGCWEDFVSICAAPLHTAGLKSDGTVAVTKYEDNAIRYEDILPYADQSGVCKWRDITAVGAGDGFTVGLKSDGSVVAVGRQGDAFLDWRGIVDVSVHGDLTVGLKSDGTVVARSFRNAPFQAVCVGDWKNIVAVSAGETHTIGLKSDGTVVTTKHVRYTFDTGNDYSGDVGNWRDIIAISTCVRATIGLKLDGTVVISKNQEVYGEYYGVESWCKIVAVAINPHYAIGVKRDGTVVTALFSRCQEESGVRGDVEGWKLFHSFDGLEEERESARDEYHQKKKQQAKNDCREYQLHLKEQKWVHRNAGLCQYCGGEFKGLFAKKCSNCGRPKDY